MCILILLFKSFYCSGDYTDISFCKSGDTKSDWMEDVDLRVKFGVEHAKSRGMVAPGDPIIVITGWQKGSGFTNTMRIIYVNGNK
jgi:pyruvate kinase